MYPFLIVEPGEKLTAQSVFADTLVLLNLKRPGIGKRYLLTKKFLTLDTCTRAFKQFVPSAEHIVEIFLPNKNNRQPQKLLKP